MSWTDPRTWTIGEVVTKVILDAHIKYNLRYLKGKDGTVTLEDGLDLGANELTINSIEIVGVDGEVNKAAVEDHTHADAANCGTIDHGVITGLGDDDHTIYLKEADLTTKGDIWAASGASTPIRVGIGTNGHILTADSGETAGVKWTASAATREFFLPAIGGTEFTEHGDNHHGYLIDAEADVAHMEFYVPADFSTIVEAVVVRISRQTATHRLNYYTDYAAIGELFDAHSESLLDQDVAETINLFYEEDISTALGSLAAGDHVGLRVKGDGTNIPRVTILGIRFKYS